MKLKLMKKIIQLWIKMLWEKKSTYQYFSTIDNKIYIKKNHFAFINFLTNLLKYKPLSSKFLKLSKDAPAGLNKIKVKMFKNLKETMKEVFFEIGKQKVKKNIIFFSPAGASFDNFKNFEDRGKYFNELIKKYIYVR